MDTRSKSDVHYYFLVSAMIDSDLRYRVYTINFMLKTISTM